MYAQATSVLETNKTLRNTFLLLSLTLLPTVGGIWFGMASGFNHWLHDNVVVGFIGMLVAMFALIFAVKASEDSAAGVPLLLVFTAVMGLVMSGAVEHVLELKNGHKILTQAVVGTSAVTFGCGLYAMVTKRDFSAWGGALFGALLALLVMMLVNMWLQLPFASLAISCIAVVLFSLYLIYDVNQVVTGGETNYISATMSIYLDIANLFINLLQIFTSIGSDD